jgi:hypothetical protein
MVHTISKFQMRGKHGKYPQSLQLNRKPSLSDPNSLAPCLNKQQVQHTNIHPRREEKRGGRGRG